jgi:hypothetical protein
MIGLEMEDHQRSKRSPVQRVLGFRRRRGCHCSKDICIVYSINYFLVPLPLCYCYCKLQITEDQLVPTKSLLGVNPGAT